MYDLIRFWDRVINFSDILLDEKLYEQKKKDMYIYDLIYDISYKASTGAKPFRIRLNKIHGFIKIHYKIRSLVLFDYRYCDKTYDKINYFISEESGITDSVNDNFARIWTDSNNFLPTEKILTFNNEIILIKLIRMNSVVNKNENNYQYNILLEKVRTTINPMQNILKQMFLYYKCYILINLTFLKELMLIKQVHERMWYLSLLVILKL